MATAPVPPNHDSYDSHRTALSIGLALALLGAILIVAHYMNRLRPAFIFPENSPPSHVAESQKPKGVEISILKSIPVVKYKSELLPFAEPRTNGAAGLGKLVGAEWAQVKESSLTTVKEVVNEQKEGCICDPPEAIVKGPPDHETSRCSICTEEFYEGENVRILPCTHIFHRRCLDPWLLGFGETCPLW